MRYLYSVVRFVPDPVRGEFVNVGAIVGSDESSEWQLRSITSLKRARSLDERHLLPRVLEFIDQVSRRLDSFSEAIENDKPVSVDISEQWLARLYEESRNIIQLSPPAPIVSEHLESALTTVFEQFILEYQVVSHDYETKHSALAAVRRAYGDSGLAKGRDFEERAIIRGKVHSERFDFSVLNGRVLQLAQAWSFQVPDQDELAERIKAWAWTVGDIRKNGGEARLRAKSIEVPRNVAIAAVYVPPPLKHYSHGSAYREALSAFEQVSVDPIPVTEAHRVGVTARLLLGDASSGPAQTSM